MTEEPKSPCVRNCCLDLDDVCLGCGRTIEEITGWHTADVTGKYAILERSQQRLDKRKYEQDL